MKFKTYDQAKEYIIDNKLKTHMIIFVYAYYCLLKINVERYQFDLRLLLLSPLSAPILYTEEQRREDRIKKYLFNVEE